MIDRQFNGGPIVLRCDACAPEYLETGTSDFAEAMAVAGDEGWIKRYAEWSAGWNHYCPDCAAERAWERESARRPRLKPGQR